MLSFASSLVDTTALWKIIAVGFVGGVGVVVAFGFVLLGSSRFEEVRRGGVVARVQWALLVLLGGAFCVAALIVGFLAMTKK
jgi:hypothetical protein